MAGGKGSRMGGMNEKPLIEIRGKSMLERVIEALRGAKSVGRIVVAVSKYTPKTRERVIRSSIDFIDTSGEDYVFDMQFAIKELRADHVLVVNSDLPLLTSALIDKVIDHYIMCGKPSLTVVAPLKKVKELGFEPSFKISIDGHEVTPVGINVIDGSRIDDVELEQEFMIVDDVIPLLNVNKVEDLRLIEELIESQKALLSI